MSYTKQELIDLLAPALVKSGHTPRDVRGVLETYALAELNEMLVKQRRAGYLRTPIEDPERVANDPEIIRKVETIRAEARRQFMNDPERIRQREQMAHDLALVHIYRVLVPGRGFAKDCASNTSIIEGWLHEDQGVLSVAWFKKVIEEPGLAGQLVWEPISTRDPVKRKQAAAEQLVQDKETFAEAARTLRSFAVNEANFNVTRKTLGESFSVYQIQQMLAANGAILSGPAKHELDQWNAEAIDQRNESLLNLAEKDPEALRARVREEATDARVQQVQEQADRLFEASRLRDAAFNYPALPSEFTKDSLIQMVKQDTQKYRFLVKKFGNHNVTARLQGRG